MTILFHGTTLWRAVEILRRRPDPDFVEPGGQFFVLGGLRSIQVYGQTEGIRLGKSRAAVREGRDEGGLAMLIVDVP